MALRLPLWAYPSAFAGAFLLTRALTGARSAGPIDPTQAAATARARAAGSGASTTGEVSDLGAYGDYGGGGGYGGQFDLFAGVPPLAGGGVSDAYWGMTPTPVQLVDAFGEPISYPTNPAGTGATGGGATYAYVAPAPSGGALPTSPTGYTYPAYLSAPNLSAAEQAAIDKVASYGGDIRTVGDYSVIPGATTEQQAIAASTNLSLVDWYKYQIAKVQAALGGTIIGESADFLAYPGRTPATYLAETLNRGNIYMYSANDPRDLAARAEALRQLGLSAIPTTAAPTTSTAAPAPTPSTAAPATSTTTAARIATLEAAIAQNEIYVRNLLADPTRTAAQNASLAAARAKIAAYSAELDSLR